MSNKPGRTQNPITMPRIDKKTAASLHCPRCGNMVFMPAVTFYLVSALQSTTGMESAGAVQVLQCLGCGWVGEIFEMAKKTSAERQEMIRAHNELVEEELKKRSN